MKKKRIFSFMLLILLSGCKATSSAPTIALEKPDMGFVNEALSNDVIKEEKESLIESKESALPTDQPVEEETVKSTPVTTSEVQEATPAPVEEQVNDNGYSGKAYGTAGRIRVPSVGIDIGLNWVDVEATPPNTGDPSPAQWVVDAYDSSAFMNVKGYQVICDHASQGFSGIIGLPIGSEICIDNTDGTTSTYYVYNSFPADNSDGYMMYNGAYSYDGINLYTCTDGSGNNVWVL